MNFADDRLDLSPKDVRRLHLVWPDVPRVVAADEAQSVHRIARVKLDGFRDYLVKAEELGLPVDRRHWQSWVILGTFVTNLAGIAQNTLPTSADETTHNP